jgi:hypothetical protein
MGVWGMEYWSNGVLVRGITPLRAKSAEPETGVTKNGVSVLFF